MKITSFNPLIVTKDSESTIALFEEMGFERVHEKEGIGIEEVNEVRMKNANGFHLDVSQGHGEWAMIRMNVDNLQEAIEFLESRGFHKARHEAAKNTVDTGSSKFNIMVSSTGYIIAVSEHNKD